MVLQDIYKRKRWVALVRSKKGEDGSGNLKVVLERRGSETNINRCVKIKCVV